MPCNNEELLVELMRESDFDDLFVKSEENDNLPDAWLHPTPIPPRCVNNYDKCCGNCKYDKVPETVPPCVECIHSMDMRKDLWQPKGE